MKKYPFAKFYLTGLLVAAILIAGSGVVVGLYYGSESVQAFFKSQTLSKKQVLIDTASVFDALQEATEILTSNQLIPTTQEIHFDYDIQKGKPARLTLKEIADFEVVLEQISGHVSSLKQQSVAKIRENLDKLITGSQSALPVKAHFPQTKQLVYRKNMEHKPLLFVDGAISENDVEALRQCGEFLKLRVQNYTPSTSAQVLARSVDADLRVLIVFLMNQLQSVKESKEVIIIPATPTSAPATETEREAHIREFVSSLQRIEETIGSVIGQTWVVDHEIEFAKKNAQEEYDKILTEITNAKSYARECGGQAIKWGVTSLIIALLLLAIRDFMSALIDTAANTGGMLNLMTPKDNNQSGDA